MQIRKSLVLAALLSLPFLAYSAPKHELGFIKKKDGKNIENILEMTADTEGNLTYKVDKIQTQMKKKDYDFAWIPMPKEIKDTNKKFKDKDYAGALEEYKKNYTSFKFLGWDAYCLYRESECLAEMGKKDDAMKKLAELRSLKIEDQEKQGKYVMEGCKLLADIYLEKGDMKSADELLAKVSMESEDDNIAAQALIHRGDLLAKMNNKREAALMYLRVAIMFQKSNKYRAEAICKAANSLKEQNDNRESKWAGLLKKDYPDSPLIKELK